MKFRALLFVFSILLFNSCTKEDDIAKSDDVSKAENDKVELVYPVNLQDINPWDIRQHAMLL